MLRTEFFPLRFMAQARSVTCRTNRDQTKLVRYFIFTVFLTGSGTISIHAELLQISDQRREQNGSI